MPDLINLTECLALTEGGAAGNLRVDREKGTIGPVKVLGYKSANGRQYLKTGIKASLYEGRRVCVGHVKTSGDRSPLDTYGLLEGVSVTDAGVYADRLRLLNPRGEFEQRLLTAAELAAHLFGLSHTACGVERPGSKGTVIESVESVESVDLVTDPATVAGLRESRSHPVKKSIKDLIESLGATRPEYSRALREMAEAGVMSPDATMDAPPEQAGATDHKQALKDACKAILEDDSLTPDDMVKKIRKVLAMIYGKSSDGGGADVAAEESRRLEVANLREELALLKSRDLLRAAADDARVTLSKAILEAIRPNITEAEAKALIAELKSAGAGSQRPRSATPVVPAPAGDGKGGTVTEGKAPTDAKEFVTYARGR